MCSSKGRVTYLKHGGRGKVEMGTEIGYRNVSNLQNIAMNLGKGWVLYKPESEDIVLK